MTFIVKTRISRGKSRKKL